VRQREKSENGGSETHAAPSHDFAEEGVHMPL
jgi:hypothetical protein